MNFKNLFITVITLSILSFVYISSREEIFINNIKNLEKVDYSDTIDLILTEIEQKREEEKRVLENGKEIVKIIKINEQKIEKNEVVDDLFIDSPNVVLMKKINESYSIEKFKLLDTIKDYIFITDTIYKIDTIFYRKEEIKKLKLKKVN
jgi:hypothetical protein